MSYDSLYFTSSPTAAILDPMGWTRTSYMPGRLEDPASRLSALSGVMPSRLAPSVDAAGTWGLDTAGPDLSALYKGAESTAAADPNAPDEPDPELLGTPIYETGEWATGLVEARANRADDLQPPAWTPDKNPNVAQQPTIFSVTRLKPSSTFSCTFYSDLLGRSVTRQINVGGNGKILLQENIGIRPTIFFGISFTSLDGAVHNGYRLVVSGTGADSKISFRFPIGNSNNTWQLGTSYSGYTINVPTATEVKAATAAYNWAAGKLHLDHLRTNLSLGSNSAINALKFYYSTWYHGRSSIPALGTIVANGSAYAKGTFFMAISRLAAAIQFNTIMGIVKAEANYTYRNSQNLYLPTRFTDGAKLTRGTTLLAGYLVSHPAVTGHMPIPVVNISGTKLADSYNYSLYVRSQIVRIGNTLASPIYRGNLKALVQNSVRLAAKYGDLEIFFDGKNDPWNTATGNVFPTTDPRGRELLERRCLIPDIPLASTVADTQEVIDILNTSSLNLNQLLATTFHAALIDHTVVDIYANPALAFNAARNYMIDEGAALLRQTIMRLAQIPGVFLGGFGVTAAAITRALDRRSWATGRSARQDLEQALDNYMITPNTQTAANLRTAYNRVTGNLRAEIPSAPVATPNEFMQVVNTVFIGGDTVQPANLPDDPYTTIVRNMAAQGSALGFVPPTFVQLMVVFLSYIMADGPSRPPP